MALRLPLVLLWRALEDDDGGFLFCVWEDEDLRVVAAGRPEPRATGVGRLRKNEMRNKGCLAAGRPGLPRESSRSLRSASSFCL